ncbi:vWA domain-containing protein [Caballeronia humi]|uniref:von Willebrand factor type A domain protein n=1 Tax=Caballeronia humi TaxID=326474 RepID=A0A158HWD7_9BURK|nr:vWA domain-containing protein [Caballeronia humi]SAL48030.1 von Willebrand factor type A domain protein [Caballeronia humi]
MTASFGFASPWMLALLPLALLPLAPRSSDTLLYSHVAWLPRDRLGHAAGIALRVLAVVTMLLIVIGLADPRETEKAVTRVARGAEIMVLMDRSSSMDAFVPPKSVYAAGAMAGGESKNASAREVLTRFIEKRGSDRVGFMMFGTSPLLVLPLTRDKEAIRSAVASTGIGRGMPDTRLDRGLLAAIGQFERRDYNGNRVIILVSDGGAHIDAPMRSRIAMGLARERITVYFIYLRSSANSTDLNAITPADESSEEVELHRYFQSLKTPYRLYQTDDSSAMAAAMAEIDAQQNFPVSYVERVPERSRGTSFFALALAGCALLFALRFALLRSWS